MTSWARWRYYWYKLKNDTFEGGIPLFEYLKDMDKKFKYEQIVIKIEQLILKLKLKPGDKIPSVRFVCKELGVSLATAVQAYAILESKGMIFSKPGSGYYISANSDTRLQTIREQSFVTYPSSVEINTMAREMVKNPRKYGVTNFSTLAPANELLPIARLNKAMQASVKEQALDNLPYPFLEGHPRLIKQISLHTFEWQLSLAHDEILVTNGCMEAINLCLDFLTKPGDLIAVECPTYGGILQSMEARGLKVIGISVNPVTGLNLDELEKALSAYNITACVFSPTCHNPLGCSMPDANKIKLVNMLNERNIPLIEDDALGEIYFGNVRPLPAKAYDKNNNVLYCSSFSKSLSPGYRIGYVSGGKYHTEIEKLKFAANISTNTILQDTIARYLESGTYKLHLKKLRIAAQTQILKYRDAISQYFPTETRVSIPAGGYSLWIELPDKINSLKLQQLALENKIAFCPGPIFSTSEAFHHYIRINCGQLWTPKIKHALQKLGDLVKSLSHSSENATADLKTLANIGGPVSIGNELNQPPSPAI
ncbi:PLP-dependent aminotransferase family protein [Chitinophaga agrisoli]|uniref:PLP-dependent aminotransferase family protein n=1 Tax=Chitinophaga agrisoli TaxID=2607653 RepID=A0A5B2VXZ0_9BACT|nr:PLP-dependent aminotransferase family protein [Chitinophaga agrisoli]KAA2243498.1 PLP-dependent aminotransferase family protein [Chitinophaga agrisoli]